MLIYLKCIRIGQNLINSTKQNATINKVSFNIDSGSSRIVFLGLIFHINPTKSYLTTFFQA